MTCKLPRAARPHLLLLALLTGLMPSTALAMTGCVEAAQQAETMLDLPHGLLRAIGTVETGERPFAVDADGTGAILADVADAVAYVRTRLAAGARFVDVGCFQIDLAYHPDAFASLETAFDPLTNAMAAGRFLQALRRRAASWPDAVARYHAAGSPRGLLYAQRVQAAIEGRVLPAAAGGVPTLFGMRVVVPGLPLIEIADARRLRLPVVQVP